jgi:hypothetical protein
VVVFIALDAILVDKLLFTTAAVTTSNPAELTTSTSLARVGIDGLFWRSQKLLEAATVARLLEVALAASSAVKMLLLYISFTSRKTDKPLQLNFGGCDTELPFMPKY